MTSYAPIFTRYVHSLIRIICLASCIFLTSCSDSEQDTNAQNNNTPPETIQPDNGTVSIEAETASENTTTTSQKKPVLEREGDEYDYQALRYKIMYSKADFHDVKLALTQKDVGGLTNTVHALYSMRWDRNVSRLIYDLWNMKSDLYPELAWDTIAKTPVRLAVASTIYRIQNLNPLENKDVQQYKEYIRAHKYDEHEFNRAQVVVALGMGGDPADVPYLEEMAAGDNRYVTQSAVTGLGLMNNKQSSDALIRLFNKHKDDARGELILAVLKKAYDLHPVNLPTDETSSSN